MLMTLCCAVGDSSSQLVLGLLFKGMLLFLSSYLLIEGILRQKFAQVNVQERARGALGPLSIPTVPFALGNASNASNATATHGVGSTYYHLLGWVVLLLMNGMLLAAVAAVAQCHGRQRRGGLACDRAKLRDVERMSRVNWLGLEPE